MLYLTLGLQRSIKHVLPLREIQNVGNILKKNHQNPAERDAFWDSGKLIQKRDDDGFLDSTVNM